MKMMEVRGERNLVADVRDTTSAQEGHCILSADLKLYSLLNAFSISSRHSRSFLGPIAWRVLYDTQRINP